MEDDLKEIPEVRLQFGYGGVALELDYRSLFVKGEWKTSFFLAMSPYIDIADCNWTQQQGDEKIVCPKS